MMLSTKDKFLNQVLIPLKQKNILNKGIWLLTDVDMSALLLSNSANELIGIDNNAVELKRKSIDILPFDNELDRSDYMLAYKRALSTKVVQRKSVTLRVGGDLMVVLISIMPIFFKGEIIAMEQLLFNVTKMFCRWDKLKQHLVGVRRLKCSRRFVRTKSEEHLIYLLLLGKKQREIALIMGLSRTRITQLIERMCTRAGVYGWSSRVLIECAVAANYHKQIPVEFLIN